MPVAVKDTQRSAKSGKVRYRSALVYAKGTLREHRGNIKVT